MKATCIEGNFNFFLSFLDCETFSYQDNSLWVENRKPEKYTVQVIPPGFSTFIPLEVKTEGITILEKDGEKLQLIDGIYCFKVDNCGTIYTKYEGVACRLQCKLNYLISQAELSDIKDYENIQHIRFLLDGFYENAKLNKPEKALKFYHLAEFELSCAKCNC